MLLQDLFFCTIYEIIEGKGATYFGISGATTKILKAIIHDTREILPVSTIYPYTSHEALLNTPIGIPAVIGENGIEQVPKLNLTEEEMTQLENSADKLHQLYSSCPVK